MAEHEESAPLERRPLERVKPRLDSVVDVRARRLRRLFLYTGLLANSIEAPLDGPDGCLRAGNPGGDYFLQDQPVYEATARVEVEAETPQIQSLSDLYRGVPGYADDAFLQTQVDVLQSENLAWRTVQQLGLGDKAGFAPVGGGGGRSPADSPL